jgi:hypothetical protein
MAPRPIAISAPQPLPGRLGPIRRRGIDAGAPFAGAVPGSVAARPEPVMTAWVAPSEVQRVQAARTARPVRLRCNPTS